MRKIFVFILLAALLACSACSGEFGQTATPDSGVMARADLSTVEQAVAVAAADLLAEINDDYATYFEPEDYQWMIEEYYGTFGGVGIKMLYDVESDLILVNSVIPDTPADAAGVQAGDLIVAVDGEEIYGLSSELAAKKIRGEIGTEVTLLLRHSDGREESLTMVRQQIESDSVSGEMLDGYPGIAYMEINDFSELTPVEFVTILQGLLNEQVIETLILDLRSNGGGSLNAAITIADYFVPEGELIVREKRQDRDQEHISGNGQLSGLPVICLQNSLTASASEVLIGALKDHDIATVIGNTSYGKGITQLIMPLGSGESAIRYTQSRYYTPSGYDLHGLGIEPDIQVDDPEEGSSSDYFSHDPERNPHLRAALDYLGREKEDTVIRIN